MHLPWANSLHVVAQPMSMPGKTTRPSSYSMIGFRKTGFGASWRLAAHYPLLHCQYPGSAIAFHSMAGGYYLRTSCGSIHAPASYDQTLVLSFARAPIRRTPFNHPRSERYGLHPVRSSLVATLTQTESLPTQIKGDVLNLLNRLPDGAALCHFDFHPDQVMLTPRGRMILDWMSALQGDPLADVARTLVLVTFGQAPHINHLMRNLINIFRGALGRSYLGHYLELHPQVTKSQVEAWMIPVAADRLRKRLSFTGCRMCMR